MKSASLPLVALLVSFVLGTSADLALRAADIKSETLGSVLRFSAGEETICDYQMKAGGLPEGMPAIFEHGAHLHPVFSPSGKMVTGNYPEDHPWHRGIWIGWTKTEFGDSQPDFWNQGKGPGKQKDAEKLLAEVRFDKLLESDEASFKSRHWFLDHSGMNEEKVLEEIWEVKVDQGESEGRVFNQIDLRSTQNCAGDKALLLPEFHYGGLGVRGNQLWNPVDAVKMLTSEGYDRAGGDSTPAKWVYIGGMVDGEPTGMAILIHPSNFRFPQPLRLNPKNPQLCVAPSQGGDWQIEPGKPYVSQYRFLAFDGEPDAKWIEAQWEHYAAAE